MKYVPIRGSWGHDPGVPGDVYLVGAPTAAEFQAMPGNPPGNPAAMGYGKGIAAENIKDTIYRLHLSLVAYGTQASTGRYAEYYYHGSLADVYTWKIIVDKTNIDTEQPQNVAYTSLFTEDLKVSYRGTQSLYSRGGWNNAHSTNEAGGTWYNDYVNQTFDSTNITWLRITLYGDDSFPLSYSYIRFVDLINDYRPMAVRQKGTWQSLNADNGFWKIRKSGSWLDIDKTLFKEDTLENKSANRIRNNGVWKAQSKIGGE